MILAYNRYQEVIDLESKLLSSTLVRKRNERGLTQKELAKHLNYSDKVISKWERGESVPDVYALERIAAFYKITIDELVNGTDTPQVLVKPYQIFFEQIKKPSLLMKLSILIPLVLVIITATIDIVWTIAALMVFFIYVIIWGIAIAQSEWICRHNNHEFRVVTKAVSCSLFLDNQLVDKQSSLISNFLLSVRMKEDTLKLRVTQIAIEISVFGLIE